MILRREDLTVRQLGCQITSTSTIRGGGGQAALTASQITSSVTLVAV